MTMVLLIFIIHFTLHIFSLDWLSTTTQAIHWRVLVDGRSETIILWTTMRTTMTMPLCLRGKVELLVLSLTLGCKELALVCFYFRSRSSLHHS